MNELTSYVREPNPSTVGGSASTAGKTLNVGKIATAVVIVASAYPVYKTITAPRIPVVVDVADYTNVTFNGYDRYGYGSVEFVTGEDEYINAAVASGYCSVTNSGTLSNGSTAKVACDYDVDYLLEQGYEITSLLQEIPVSGLLPVTYIDLFDGVSVEWVVDPEDNTTAIQVDSANPNLSDVKYIIKQSDDEGNVIVHASVDFSVLNHNGFEVSGNQFDKVYHIGRRPDISAENLIS